MLSNASYLIKLWHWFKCVNSGAIYFVTHCFELKFYCTLIIPFNLSQIWASKAETTLIELLNKSIMNINCFEFGKSLLKIEYFMNLTPFASKYNCSIYALHILDYIIIENYVQICSWRTWVARARKMVWVETAFLWK